MYLTVVPDVEDVLGHARLYAQMPGSMDGRALAHAVNERSPPIKVIVVSGALKLPVIESPAQSRFLGKPREPKRMIAEMQNMIGHA